MRRISPRTGWAGIFAPWALLLAIAGCKSLPPPDDQASREWLVAPSNAPLRAAPGRMTSPIAPAPESAPNAILEPTPPSATKALSEAAHELTPPPADGKLYSFTAKDLDVKDALALFARNNELNIVPDPDVSGQVTVDFRNLTLEKSMDAILDTFGYFAEIDRGLIRVRKLKTEFFTVDYLRLNRGGNGNTTASVSSGGGASASGGGGGGGGADTTSVTINKADNIKFWDELDEQMKALVSPAGKFAINRTAGQIMVTDQKATVDRIGQYLKHIKRTLHRQVDLEAQIFEVVLNDEFHFGIDWRNVMGSIEKWAISSGGVPAGIPSSSLIVNNPMGGLAPGAPALSLSIAKDQTRVLLDALRQMGKLEVVSQPRVRTLNNQAAMIKVGSDKPFFRTRVVSTPTSLGTAQTQTDVEVQTITIGTVLALTPQISDDGWITMDVSPVITRLVATVAGPGNAATAPEVDIKQTSSLIRVRHGQTIVLGGLIQNERYKTTRRVPILGDIPILGYPFRGVFDDTRKTELVIFLTPTIVE